jgi:hypothetical protein
MSQACPVLRQLHFSTKLRDVISKIIPVTTPKVKAEVNFNFKKLKRKNTFSV